MKAIRLISILTLVIATASCRDGKNPIDQEVIKEVIDNTFIPDWEPPMGDDALYLDDEAGKPADPVYLDEADEVDKVVIEIKRDTIQGIAVRAPEKISIPEQSYRVDKRTPTEEAFYDIAYISTNRYVGVNFDNDIFNNTDYYYTNGIRIDYVSPVFASSPFAYPMLPYKKLSMNYHGMTVVQNMYTPTNPDTVMLLVGDRPFAAYLYLGHFKNTLVEERRYRQYSELQIGLIGPGSLGGFVQSTIHDIPPMGWDNQIENDIVLNYTAEVEKGILNPELFDLNIYGRGQLGTLYTNAGGGVRIRFGKMNPYFAMPWLAGPGSVEGKHSRKWQYGIFATAYAKSVLYDATLQGGVFNNTNNYTISAGDIERFVFQATGGIFFAYRQIGLMYEQFYTTPEFKGALHHRWGHINVTYCF